MMDKTEVQIQVEKQRVPIQWIVGAVTIVLSIGGSYYTASARVEVKIENTERRLDHQSEKITAQDAKILQFANDIGFIRGWIEGRKGP